MKNNYADCDAQPTFESATGGGEVSITIADDPLQFWCIDWISWSYDDTPAGGKLTVEAGGAVLWEVDITVGGPGHLEFYRGLYGLPGEEVVITLADAGVSGSLNVRYR